MPQVSNFPDDAWQVSPTKYFDDPSITTCTNCQINFSIVVRRHACTTCPYPFCGKCSLGRVYQEDGKFVRRRRCVVCAPLTADEEAARAAFDFDEEDDDLYANERPRSFSAAVHQRSPLRSQRRTSTGSLEKSKASCFKSPTRSPPPFTIHDDDKNQVIPSITVTGTSTRKDANNVTSSRLSRPKHSCIKQGQCRTKHFIGGLITVVIVFIAAGIHLHLNPNHFQSAISSRDSKILPPQGTFSLDIAPHTDDDFTEVTSVLEIKTNHIGDARSSPNDSGVINLSRRPMQRFREWLQRILHGAQSAMRNKIRKTRGVM